MGALEVEVLDGVELTPKHATNPVHHTGSNDRKLH